MRATHKPRRLLPALIATATAVALFLAVPTATADPDGSGRKGDRNASPPAAITSGSNGQIAWVSYYYDSATFTTTSSLRSSSGNGFFHPIDSLNTRPDMPEFSPDGGRLAYSVYGGSAAAQGLWVVTNPFGVDPNLVRLTKSAFDQDPTWSPDGTRIAFLRSQVGPAGIWVVNSDGSGTPVELWRLGDPFSHDLSWSPDGTKIAFSDYCCGYNTTEHIYVLDLNGGGVADLGAGTAPSWKPDGSKIVYEYVYSASDHDLYQMNPDGTGVSGISTSSINETQPTWSPDGAWIAAVAPAGIVTINVSTLARGSSYSDSNAGQPTWAADQTLCQGRRTTISGTSGPDTLRGSNGVDVINGLGGDDTIVGLQGQDIICGGAGNDTVSYAGQTNAAHAEIGGTDPASGVSDLIAPDVENLVGGAGPDVLVGDDNANTLTGNRGDDTIHAGGGGDAVTGGGGDDTLVGDDGDDTLTGEGGEDVLRGGDGDDQLVGGDDSDRMVGGPGTDTADYTGRAQPVDVTIGGPAGEDGGKVDGGAGDRDTVAGSVENLVGGNGADTLVGNDLNNDLRGNLGADTFQGGDGRDIIRAKDGVRDAVIDCGPDVDAAAVVDAIDPAAISCT